MLLPAVRAEILPWWPCSLQGDAAIPVLHSFPTRRSSDLVSPPAPGLTEPPLVASNTTDPVPESVWAALPGNSRVGEEPVRDPNGTRLNCRHRRISDCLLGTAITLPSIVTPSSVGLPPANW